MAKILVIDDEPVYLSLLTSVLKRDGHEVTTAETGENAVELGRTTCPDVLLADWAMKSGMSGLDAARALRKANSRLGIIIMTGYSAADMGSEASDLEGLAVLRKPFDGDTVRRLVREAADLAGGPH